MLLSCLLGITCFVVSVQGSVVDTHGQQLTSKAGHTALCCQVKESVTRIALFSSVTKGKGTEKINTCKIFTMSLWACEITKNTYSEGGQDPSRRQDLDRLQKVERHVFLGCIRESNVKVVANKCGGVI